MQNPVTPQSSTLTPLTPVSIPQTVVNPLTTAQPTTAIITSQPVPKHVIQIRPGAPMTQIRFQPVSTPGGAQRKGLSLTVRKFHILNPPKDLVFYSSFMHYLYKLFDYYCLVLHVNPFLNNSSSIENESYWTLYMLSCQFSY